MIQKFQQIDELLKNARRVLVTSHEHPDPDAVASILTTHHIFKKRGIEHGLYLPDEPPKNLYYLPGFFNIQTKIDNLEPDLLFCLDYGDFKRLHLPEHVLASPDLKIITIDHHVESDQQGSVKIIEPDFSSTSELIYHWAKYQNIGIDKDMAVCLLTGIISDSGGFRHVSTSSETLNIVSELLSKGISLNKISCQTLSFKKPPNLLQAWGMILVRTKLDEKNHLAYSWITPEDLGSFTAKATDFDGITNLISAASPKNLGLLLLEYEKGKIKGSLRSEPQGGVNVVQIAKALGGGGHAYAAGFNQEGTIEEVLKRVLDLVK